MTGVALALLAAIGFGVDDFVGGIASRHVAAIRVVLVSYPIAMALLVAYLLVSGETFLATAVSGVFKMSFAGVGPTELRILLAVGTVALRRDPHGKRGL